MSQGDLDELKTAVDELRQRFEDLAVEFAGFRRLIKERLDPTQIAKLEELMEKAGMLDALLGHLPQLPEIDPQKRFEQQLRSFFRGDLPAGVDIEKVFEEIVRKYDEPHTYEELKQMCKEKGLSTSGDKKGLGLKLWLKEKNLL